LLTILIAKGQKESKTLIEKLMDTQTCKFGGLQKLIKKELQNLSQRLKDALNIKRYVRS